MGVDYKVLDVGGAQTIKGVLNQGTIGDRYKRLRTPVGKRSQPRAQSGSENERRTDDAYHRNALNHARGLASLLLALNGVLSSVFRAAD